MLYRTDERNQLYQVISRVESPYDIRLAYIRATRRADSYYVPSGPGGLRSAPLEILIPRTNPLPNVVVTEDLARLRCRNRLMSGNRML